MTENLEVPSPAKQIKLKTMFHDIFFKFRILLVGINKTHSLNKKYSP